MSANRWWVKRDQEVFGPYETDELRAHIAQEAFTPIDMVSHDGTTGWAPLWCWKGSTPNTKVVPEVPLNDLFAGDVAPPLRGNQQDRLGTNMSNSTMWYYAINGRQMGPVDWQGLVALVQVGTVTSGTPVWGGEGDWRPANQTALAHVFAALRPPGPPPLTGDHVNNNFMWTIVAVPLVGTACDALIDSNKAVGVSTLLCIGLNILLCVLDANNLKAAGHPAPPGSWSLIVPVYLWKRATMLKKSRTNFAVWCGTFVLSILISAALAGPETRARVLCNPTNDSFSCTVIHDQGRATVNVCWDVVMACNGGIRAIGHACQVVSPQQTTTRVIPESEVQNLAQCQAATAITVENVTVTAQ